MELSATAHVILGMLGLGPKSGYDIKNLVDRSTRFFWAASYGQIYPELRRLAAAGLIEGEDDPESARRRTVYRLTPSGRDQLERWLASAAETHETRDESLLKIFFSDAGGPEATLAALERKRELHAELAARLRAIEADAEKPEQSSTYLTLRFGIAFNEFIADWCEREAERRRPTGSERRAA